jgi:hypothetical protein
MQNNYFRKSRNELHEDELFYSTNDNLKQPTEDLLGIIKTELESLSKNTHFSHRFRDYV